MSTNVATLLSFIAIVAVSLEMTWTAALLGAAALFLIGHA